MTKDCAITLYLPRYFKSDIYIDHRDDSRWFPGSTEMEKVMAQARFPKAQDKGNSSVTLLETL